MAYALSFNRVTTGDGMRRTRFHNYRGECLDLPGFRYLPHCLYSILALKLFGYRPRLPWLGYRAIKRLGELIQPDWKVLEFGSGMSTLWLAKRCRLLVSIETNEEWFNRVNDLLRDRNIKNVDYRLLPDGQEHLIPDCNFDLVIVDGLNRDVVMLAALQKILSDGYVYMDNTDVQREDHREARQSLLNAASHVEVFNDLYPTILAVNEGLLVNPH